MLLLLLLRKKKEEEEEKAKKFSNIRTSFVGFCLASWQQCSMAIST